MAARVGTERHGQVDPRRRPLADLREQLTVSYVFITHDLAVAQQVTDEVIVMRRGRVVEHGSTDWVLSTPEHPDTRGLLDAAPREGWRRCGRLAEQVRCGRHAPDFRRSAQVSAPR